MIPIYSINIDGTDITHLINKRLLSLIVTEEIGQQSDEVEIRLDDSKNDLEIPKRGVRLAVAMGYRKPNVADILAHLGTFVVDEVELSVSPSTMTIRAKAADMSGSIKTRKSRHFDNIALGDLISTIAKEHGLTPRVSPELADIQIKYLAQSDESDMNLLTRVASQYDAVSKPAEGHWIFVKRGQSKSVSGKKLIDIDVERKQLISGNLVYADREKYQSTKAFYQDLATGKREEVNHGEGEPSFALPRVFKSKEQAEIAAQSKYQALSRSKVKGNLQLVGNPNIAAEYHIILKDIRSGINGRWLVTRKVHQYTSNGFTTQLNIESP